MVSPNGLDFDGARFQKTLSGHCLVSFSIPSARYTDKADGSEYGGASAGHARQKSTTFKNP
jgi:hypothetical protein